MSVVFDGVSNGPIVGFGLSYVFPDQRPSGFPVSATVWIWIDGGQAPGSGETWTVWWLGQTTTNYLALRITESGGTLQVSGQIGGTSASLQSSAQAISTGAWHCVSVVATESGGTVSLRTYLDGAPPQLASGALAGADPTGWINFRLGFDGAAATPINGRFTLEQMAIWNRELAQANGGQDSDNHRMFEGRIPPKDAADRMLGVGVPPDFSYWYLAGHRKNGLRAPGNDDIDIGERWNDAPATSSGFRRPLNGVFSDLVPVWSANTPVFRYFSDQAIDVVPRPRITEPSRLQPYFWFSNGPTTGPTGQGDVRALAYYTDPNMSVICNSDYRDSLPIQPLYGPGVPVIDPYIPRSDLSMIAKRCADFFAVQDMTLGKGSGPGGKYAGAVAMRGIGEGTRSHVQGQGEGVLGWVGPTPDMQYAGRDTGFPLEQHPGDWVYGEADPNKTYQAYWAAWYRQEGVRLNTIYMERFWKALSEELDDRGLCYPLRAHFDYEGWVRDTTQLRYVNPESPNADMDLSQVGAWPLIEADARYATEMLVYEIGGDGQPVHKTLDDLGAPSYDDEASFYASSNRPFATWWWSYQYPMRMQAVAEGLFPDMATYLPETTWANYDGFVADNPGYRFLDTQDDRAWNSAPRAITPGDQATPVLYTGGIFPKLRGDLKGRLGYTLSETIRDWHTSQIDACASSRAAKPIVPTFENVGRLMTTTFGPSTFTYQISIEDMRVQVEHAWRRGGIENIMFVFDPNDIPFERVVENVGVTLWLRDYVHTVPQNAQARTGRLSRVARRSL